MGKVSEEWNFKKHGSAAMLGRLLAERNGHKCSPIIGNQCKGFPKVEVLTEKSRKRSAIDEVVTQFSKLLR